MKKEEEQPPTSPASTSGTGLSLPQTEASGVNTLPSDGSDALGRAQAMFSDSLVAKLWILMSSSGGAVSW